ncbi:kelch-like protein 24 isoform X2 [Stylophora pistillata]|uniref:Kelch-like protein 24 n=1 Tax=Stylophora pistillata TaxID=50429 RepID=A0A2B4SV68_STYPI|nr:kelch-like protein 24 isoform X2 [Stylophora pistillata]PFX33781.1 Kelch-like protein 24 [Stylophora pistillata]
MAFSNSGDVAEIAQLNVMQSITSNEEIIEKGANSSDEKGEKAARHHFSEPWGDSDVVLVVEDEKFHVHRQILSLNSPVFRAMFKSQFKEATVNEIPLPGKKAHGVLDFLMKIYGPQYTRKEVEITLENVEQLMQLSDEYQVTEHIFQPCVKFLEYEPKTKENVMKIRGIAEFYDLEKVRQQCDKLLSGMKLETLSETIQFENVEKDKLQHFLTQRIEVLEGYLEKLYPQFMGLLACCLWLWHEAKRNLKWCSTHFKCGKAQMNIDSCIKKCKVCQEMLDNLVLSTQLSLFSNFPYHTYGNANFNRHRFDESLQNIIHRYSQVMT